MYYTLHVMNYRLVAREAKLNPVRLQPVFRTNMVTVTSDPYEILPVGCDRNGAWKKSTGLCDRKVFFGGKKMKSVFSEKEFSNILERYKKADYRVNTNITGSTNMAMLELGDESYCETWKVKYEDHDDYFDHPKHVNLFAYGDSKSGEILITGYGGHESAVHLVGKGREGRAKVLIIQRTGDGFNVVWNSDLPENKATFYMTVTDKVLLKQLIELMAEKYFPTVNRDTVQESTTLLTEGNDDE